jgi:hyperpolarization activated cyclic nucleotide-gated potassium channel 2
MHMKRFRLTINTMNLIITIWTLMLMLHLIACFWGVAGKFNLSTNLNWIFVTGIQDEDVIYSYFTALYWASVTIMTVGYGDILP